MGNYQANLKISLKKGVLDPQGSATMGALVSLGYEVTDVRVGKQIMVEFEAESREEALALVDEMAKRLLANPVIEDYSFMVEEVGETK